MTARWGAVRLTGSLAAVLVAAGCLGVPTGGPVQRAPDSTDGEITSTRFVPAGPAEDAAPEAIVSGYIESMLGYPADPQITSAFLTDEAAESWRPGARTAVYESIEIEVPEVAEDATRVTAALNVTDRATLDANGRFDIQRSTRQIRLELERQDGQWRVANPPNGVLLSGRYFDENVRVAALHYFDPSGERLIADPVHVIDDDRAATRLVTALFDGTDDVRSAEVVSYVPEGASLRGEVEVVDGVAEVRLRQALTALGPDEQERVIAQITATLVQLDSVSGVRVTATGTDVVATSSTLAAFRPPLRSADVYAVRDERLVRLSADEVAPVEGPWDEAEVTSREVVVHAAGARVALVDDDAVEVRDLDSGEPIIAVDGRDVVSAAWDIDGALWIVDRDADDGWRIRVVRGDEVEVVRAAGWAMDAVDSFDLSPDGARFAAVVVTPNGQRRLATGAVLRDEDGAVVGAARPTNLPTPDLDDLSSVMWVTAGDLALSARGEASLPQPLVIHHDGWQDRSLSAERPAPPVATGLAVVVVRARSGDVYVESDDGVWVITASLPWAFLEGVRAPSRAY